MLKKINFSKPLPHLYLPFSPIPQIGILPLKLGIGKV